MAEGELESFRGSTTRWLFGSFAGWLTLLLCFAGIGAVLIIFKWLANVSARYDLTDQRLIIRKGIIFKSIDEIELYRVKDVKVTFSLLNQMADIGTISLVSSDLTSKHAVFTLADIPQARQRRETLRKLIEQNRQRRRVREVDVEGEWA